MNDWNQRALPLGTSVGREGVRRERSATRGKRILLNQLALVSAAVLSACGGGEGPDSGTTRATASSESPHASALALSVGPAQAQSNSVIVRARGDLAANVGPSMKLRVNGVVVGAVEVRSSTYADYSFDTAVPLGATVEVVFDNDFFDSTGDRNLYVESITVNGSTIASTADGVVFDRGLGAQAFDGLDVLPGLNTLWWNGALRFVAGAAPTPIEPNTIVVRARGALAANVGPNLKLRVNGEQVGAVEVRSSAYTDYKFSAAVPSGAKVEVVFDNDYYDGSGDRNLFVESITVNGATIAATAPGVVFDRGAGARAFDGLDVLPGLNNLWWNGALRFTAGNAPTPTPGPDAGPCAYAPVGQACKIDEMAYNTVGTNDSTEEVVVAYGRLWKYNLGGQLIQQATSLKGIGGFMEPSFGPSKPDIPGPCNGLPSGQDCEIDSLTILNHDQWGYVVSVSAYGRGWNFDANGKHWANGGSNFDLTSINRYGGGLVFGPTPPGPCSYKPSGSVCKFDTRTFVDARAEWGDYFESITAYGRYFIFNSKGSLIESNTLASVTRYKDGPVVGPTPPGPCTYKPAGSVCKFDSAEIKRVNGKLVEVITAYGRYWEFVDGSDTAVAGTGVELKNVARFQ